MNTKLSLLSNAGRYSLFLLGVSVHLTHIGCKTENQVNQSASLVFDFDQDGVPDEADLDDDNDGIVDVLETTYDLDLDNVPNHQDRDSDSDGIPDLIEATGVDKDGDGMLDPWDEWEDENRNGYHDEYEEEPLVELKNDWGTKVWKSRNSFGNITVDLDKDGVPNFWDKDSDNDSVGDGTEAGTRLGEPKLIDSNADGFDDRLVGFIATKGDKLGRSGHPEIENGESLYMSKEKNSSTGKGWSRNHIDFNDNKVPDFLEK